MVRFAVRLFGERPVFCSDNLRDDDGGGRLNVIDATD